MENSNMLLIQTLILQPTSSTTKEVYECIFPMTNDLSLQQEYFMKSTSAPLHCISELCSAMHSTVATVHESFHSQHQIETVKFGRMQHVKINARNNWKIWKLKQYEPTAALVPHNILQLHILNYFCSWTLHNNGFTLVNVTSSSKLETWNLYSII